MTTYRIIKNQPWPLYAAVVLMIGLALSFWPRLDLGMSMGLNLKLPFVFLAITFFIGVSLPEMYRQRRVLLQSTAVRVIMVFAAWSTLTIAWSQNITRGAAEALLIWLAASLFVAVVAQLRAGLWQRHAQVLTRSFWVVVAAVGVFALWQLVGEALGVSPRYTLLPTEYRSHVFGFARPTGFALEPEFLANWLLIPALTSLWLILRGRAKPLLYAMSIFVLTVLGVTVSRGAFVALAAGFIIVIITTKSTWRHRGATLGVVAMGMIMTLSLIGLTAQVNQRDTIDGQTAVAGSVNHVSLGTIEIEPKEKATDTSVKKVKESEKPAQASPDDTPQYVQSSTSSRLKMAREALLFWSQDMRTILFGIGQGSFGQMLHNEQAKYPVKSIVNNQYVAILSELGIAGLLLLSSLLGVILYRLGRAKQWLLFAIISAVLVQWLFFSGYINVLHLWPLLAVGYWVVRYTKSKEGKYDVKSTNEKTD